MSRLIAFCVDTFVVLLVCSAGYFTIFVWEDGERWWREDGYGRVMMLWYGPGGMK